MNLLVNENVRVTPRGARGPLPAAAAAPSRWQPAEGSPGTCEDER